MKIELAKMEKMSQTGSSLLRLIQNNDMPVLDLLVREAVQNSLDAHKHGVTAVNVDFLTGKFSNALLAAELDGITGSLKRKFPMQEYDYLAIRDTNTVGLTGPLKYSEIKDNNYGNLLKLVYEICKPQENEGAGGSWGIGKTVYYRIGIGLVIFYSRVKLDDDSFQSRLAVAYVEDERSPDRLLSYQTGTGRGIAWWGDPIDNGETMPVTDENEVNRFLSIFGIAPYDAEQTGTTVIIPYVNPSRLLEDNAPEIKDNELRPYWYYSIEDYLSIAAQRWYAPRINNMRVYNNSYGTGPSLRVKINGESIDVEPLFQIVRGLFTRAFEGVKKQSIKNRPDYIDENDIDFDCYSIKATNHFDGDVAGCVAFAKVTEEALKIPAPDNAARPELLVWPGEMNSEYNAPILCYTRKPGMIVSYESSGSKWLAKVPETEKNEYLIAFFVPHSELRFSGISSNFEEYLRKSEQADHTEWKDHSLLNGKGFRIIASVQNKVSRAISEKYSEESENDGPKRNNGLGTKMGSILLPPRGFGKKGSGTDAKSAKGGSATIERHRGSVLKLESKKYKGSSVYLNFALDANANTSVTGIETGINTDSGFVDSRNWIENYRLDCPFYIESVTLCDKSGNSIVLGNGIDESTINGQICSLEKINDLITALNITNNQHDRISLKIQINLTVLKKDMQPVFRLKK